MTHQRSYHTTIGISGAIPNEPPRSLAAAMMALVILVGVIATQLLV